jgi:hypothetical protein
MEICCGFLLIKHLWIKKVLFLSMETFRGHENSRDIKFNENQREKTAIIKTEQNAEGTCKSKKMKEKEQNI